MRTQTSGDSLCKILTTSGYNFCRLWYRPTPGLRGHPSQLGFMDTVPVYLNPGEKHPKFETLPTTVERINRKLSENPLPGQFPWTSVHICLCEPSDAFFFPQGESWVLKQWSWKSQKWIGVRDCSSIPSKAGGLMSTTPTSSASSASSMRKALLLMRPLVSTLHTLLKTLSTILISCNHFWYATKPNIW